jgi:hypothetical protein
MKRNLVISAVAGALVALSAIPVIAASSLSPSGGRSEAQGSSQEVAYYYQNFYRTPASSNLRVESDGSCGKPHDPTITACTARGKDD